MPKNVCEKEVSVGDQIGIENDAVSMPHLTWMALGIPSIDTSITGKLAS